MSYDLLQASCWTVVYIVAIIYSIKYRTHIIPAINILLNFGWEVTALLYWRRLIYLGWIIPDLIILVLFLMEERYDKKRNIRIVLESLGIIIVYFVIFQNKNGTLYSSFAIDLVMAILFCIKIVRENVNIYNIGIGILKLIGDWAAWRYYRYDQVVDNIGIIVLIFNLIYVILAIRGIIRKNEKKRTKAN